MVFKRRLIITFRQSNDKVLKRYSVLAGKRKPKNAPFRQQRTPHLGLNERTIGFKYRDRRLRFAKAAFQQQRAVENQHTSVNRPQTVHQTVFGRVHKKDPRGS